VCENKELAKGNSYRWFLRLAGGWPAFFCEGNIFPYFVLAELPDGLRWGSWHRFTDECSICTQIRKLFKSCQILRCIALLYIFSCMYYSVYEVSCLIIETI
jgi:hypothetical protein